MDKCKKCGAPISGFFAKIAALAGVKPSVTKPGYCNKCENEVDSPVTPQEDATTEEPKDLFDEEENKG